MDPNFKGSSAKELSEVFLYIQHYELREFWSKHCLGQNIEVKPHNHCGIWAMSCVTLYVPAPGESFLILTLLPGFPTQKKL